MISSTPRPHFTPGKVPIPIVQEAGWAPGPVLTGGKYRLHRDSIPDRPARSQSLYRLSYPAHNCCYMNNVNPFMRQVRKAEKISVSRFHDTWRYSAVQGGMTPTARRCLAVRGATRGVTRHHNKQAALSPLPERNSRVASEPFSAKC